ncbi:ferredoxin [Nocardiopsis sp. RV163]|uniref:ferredoxin n=1 Tax=Nocardiopsis sp. RV163 TaxID=1661388 RepID=UPI00064B9BCE|nr:ferredoxin [Nocardiopsis sp. RV163]
MRVEVDYDQCESNALCAAAAPEVFEVRDDDFLYLLTGEPAAASHERVRRAERLCPKRAITVRE